MKHRVYCTGCVNRSFETTVSHKRSEQYCLFSFPACPRRLSDALWTTDEHVTYQTNPFILYNDWRRKYFPSYFRRYINIYRENLRRIHNHIRHGLPYLYFKFNTNDFLKNYMQYNFFLHYLNMYVTQESPWRLTKRKLCISATNQGCLNSKLYIISI